MSIKKIDLKLSNIENLFQGSSDQILILAQARGRCGLYHNQEISIVVDNIWLINPINGSHNFNFQIK